MHQTTSIEFISSISVELVDTNSKDSPYYLILTDDGFHMAVGVTGIRTADISDHCAKLNKYLAPILVVHPSAISDDVTPQQGLSINHDCAAFTAFMQRVSLVVSRYSKAVKICLDVGESYPGVNPDRILPKLNYSDVLGLSNDYHVSVKIQSECRVCSAKPIVPKSIITTAGVPIPTSGLAELLAHSASVRTWANEVATSDGVVAEDVESSMNGEYHTTEEIPSEIVHKLPGVDDITLRDFIVSLEELTKVIKAAISATKA